MQASSDNDTGKLVHAGRHPHGEALDERLAGLALRARRQLREARQQIDHGRAEVAVQLLARAVASDPRIGEHVEFLRLLGVARHLQMHHDQALGSLRRAAELQPDDALVLTNLGTVLGATGYVEEALEKLRRACDLAPDFPAAWYNLGRGLGRQSRTAEAHAAYAQALRCDPQNSKARIAYADSLRKMGRIVEAGEQYREALRHPGSILAWFRLVNLGNSGLTETDIDSLRGICSSPQFSEQDRAIAGFSLAKALEDHGRYREAFSALNSANAHRRRRAPWDANAFQKRNAAIASAFDQPPPSASPAELGHQIIFLVGLPHSGAGLIENALLEHPDVEGARELPELWNVLNRESDRRGSAFPAWVGDASPGDWRRMGEEYLERTHHWRSAQTRFVDKALNNWRIVGAAQAMLPGARFVNARRDPLETCLSCYRKPFARGHAFPCDLTDLGEYWQEYDRMMRRWNARYPHRVHDLDHDELPSDPAAQLRSLLEFCGLPFDTACLGGDQLPRSAPRHAHLYAGMLAPLRLAMGLPAETSADSAPA